MEICVTPSSSVADVVSFFNTSKRLGNSSVCENFVPLPVTEKSNWIHDVSLRSFSATANSASWFSPSSGLSATGAVINAATSRIRRGFDSHQFLVSTTPKFSPNPVSDASSRDKIQAVYSDGRRCDRSSPSPSNVHSVVCFVRKWSLWNCWSPWCWNKKPVVHASPPVCTQTNLFFRKGLFCTHLERHRYEHEHVTQTTPAPKTEIQKAQEVKPEPQQCHQTLNEQSALNVHCMGAKKTRSPTLLEQH